MARRKKPYKAWVAVIDVILTVLTSGLWLLVVLFRELYYRQ